MTKHFPMKPVDPIVPAVRYCGGKRLLAKRLCQEIDQVPHSSYVEPFCGMGGVFFRRTSKPSSEVINDLNKDVATLFRVARRHPAALMEELRFKISSRDDFERLKRLVPHDLTDIERAARFFFLQRCAFGGRLTRRAFGVQRGAGAALFQADKALRYIEKIHQRLQRVTIEALPYQEAIRRYDSETTLFYLDPPYWGSGDLYGLGEFKRSEFEELADILERINGRFILSLNDTPGVREVFAAFKRIAV